jgi:hypothetical protein
MTHQMSEAGLRRLASAMDSTPVPAASTGCCGEAYCRRKYPIGIYRGDFTGQVYAATAMRLVRDHGDGTGTFAATVKHDVTAQVARFIRANEAWVREVLDGAA